MISFFSYSTVVKLLCFDVDFFSFINVWILIYEKMMDNLEMRWKIMWIEEAFNKRSEEHLTTVTINTS